jgi:hypothetical protein
MIQTVYINLEYLYISGKRVEREFTVSEKTKKPKTVLETVYKIAGFAAVKPHAEFFWISHNLHTAWCYTPALFNRRSVVI